MPCVQDGDGQGMRAVSGSRICHSIFHGAESVVKVNFWELDVESWEIDFGKLDLGKLEMSDLHLGKIEFGNLDGRVQRGKPLRYMNLDCPSQQLRPNRLFEHGRRIQRQINRVFAEIVRLIRVIRHAIDCT